MGRKNDALEATLNSIRPTQARREGINPNVVERDVA